MTPRASQTMRHLIRSGLVAVVAVWVAALAIATNIATELLPQWPWLENRVVMWALVALLTAGTATLGVLQHRQSAEVTSGDRPTNPMAGGPDETPNAPVAHAHNYLAPVTQLYQHSFGARITESVPASNLPPRNPHFTGREDAIARLNRLVSGKRGAAIALHGMGGAGKSQIALEFAHRARTDDHYQITWWVRAESELTMVEDLTRLASALGISAGSDLYTTANDVVIALRSMSDWLIVLDNASDATTVRNWVPGGSGDTLITSRTRPWIGLANGLNVGPFDRLESVAYLINSSSEFAAGNDQTSAEMLAEELGDLPLALTEAATYMEAHRLSLSGYLHLFRRTEAQGSRLTELAVDYPRTVATTWLIHHATLAEQQPGALTLLRLFAFLDPDEIPTWLITDQALALKGPIGRELAWNISESELEELVGSLARLNLVTRLDDSHVGMHRLVAEATRSQLTSDGMNALDWVHWVARIVAASMPDDTWGHESWPVMTELAPHAAKVLEHCGTLPTPEAGELLTKLGAYLAGRGDTTAARNCLRKALTFVRSLEGPYSMRVADVASLLGNAEDDLGNMEAALNYLELSLLITEELFGTDNLTTAFRAGHLGRTLYRVGDFETSQAVLELSLGITAKQAGEMHPMNAFLLSILGRALSKGGSPVNARSALDRARIILEEAFGPDAPQLTSVLAGLSRLQRDAGDLRAARNGIARAISITENTYGPDHPNLESYLRQLSEIETDMGELHRAAVIAQRADALHDAFRSARWAERLRDS
ncbi:tetratricopeptide repeat protein [Cryptosporangium arvum]|uniref:NB-ARC domain protein n=1 Tax=Cryptosporangium arvum DSM 44712 TaxID=927661 RepID=A0A010ZXP3_9ACTN|nr:NB-ARC domain protein [Cryptosporangium arvum DSM 44712]